MRVSAKGDVAAVTIIRMSLVVVIVLFATTVCESRSDPSSEDPVSATIVGVEPSSEPGEVEVTYEVINLRSDPVEARCQLHSRSDSYSGVTLVLSLEADEEQRDTVKLPFTDAQPSESDLEISCKL